MLGVLSFEILSLGSFLLSVSFISFFRSKQHLQTVHNPIPVNRSVSQETARTQQNELRVLTVRLESLKSLVERLKSSHGEGLITDEEFDALSKKHMEEIRQLDRHIVRKRLIVELYELEEIEEEMTKAFAAKISELRETILLVRRKLGFEPAESQRMTEVPVPPRLAKPVPPPPEEVTTSIEPAESTPPAIEPAESTTRASTGITKESRQTPQPVERTKANEETEEQKVEDELSRIKADVEKLLEELEQMEQPRS